MTCAGQYSVSCVGSACYLDAVTVPGVAVSGENTFATAIAAPVPAPLAASVMAASVRDSYFCCTLSFVVLCTRGGSSSTPC